MKRQNSIQSLIGLFTPIKALSRGLVLLNALPSASALLRMSGGIVPAKIVRELLE